MTKWIFEDKQFSTDQNETLIFFFAFVEIAVNVNTGELLRQQNNKKKFSADGWIFASKG